MIANRARRWAKTLMPGLLIAATLNAQQPVQVASADPSNTKDDISTLKQQLADQQKQLEQLRTAMQKQQELIERATKQMEATEAVRRNPAASLGEVASTTPVLPMPAVAVPANQPINVMGAQVQPGNGDNPLYIQIGAARFTPLGFVDAMNITRSTNTGGALGTGFNNFPYSNTAPGNLTETRFSLQNSRLGLRIDSKILGYDVLGYWESDFLGNAPTNLYTTSNADTFRLRLLYVDLKKDTFEFLGGQSWSLFTPGRKGISPIPSDIFYTQDVDTNYQAGLTWARQAGFRGVWHPNPHFHWAFAVEDPEQYIGGAVVLPGGASGSTPASALNTALTAQLNQGALNSTPNLMPDLISKVAFDGTAPGHSSHLEIVGLFRAFKTYNPTNTTHYTTTGGGISLNGNVEIVKNIRLVGTTFWSDGGGRYIGGLVPDLTVDAQGQPHALHSGSGIGGIEAQATKNLLIYGYYSGIYIQKGVQIDSNGKPIGYGYTGSANSANRSIQEITFGFTQNFWKSPQWGALSLMMQYSYLTRNPWYLAAGALDSASLQMGYVNLRYTLP